MPTQLLNMDCMKFMKDCADNSFDLAIVDPPYGISYARGVNGYGTNDNKPERKSTAWDVPPGKEYFSELIRCSKNQIVWGGNYFTDKIPVSKCWLVWDKIGDMEMKNPFADCELAWTSFGKVVKKVTIRQQGFINDSKNKTRIHPTQKPVALYKWLLKNYAEKGQTILDTHLGSGSSAIAAHYFGCDFTGIEIDEDYFKAAQKRFAHETRQISMF